VSLFSYSTDFDDEGINYDAKLKLGAIPIAVDVFPFKNWFRIGGGVVINLTEATGTGKPTSGGQITIGDTTYNITDLGQVNGKVKFNRAAPYFGIGFNNPIKKSGRLGFFVDLGLLYQGSPVTSLTTTKTVAGLQPEIDKQLSKTKNDLSDFKLFPVVQLGFSYKF
jgi:hypothetical protein